MVKSSDEPEEIWLQKSDYMIITVDVCLVWRKIRNKSEWIKNSWKKKSEIYRQKEQNIDISSTALLTEEIIMGNQTWTKPD